MPGCDDVLRSHVLEPLDAQEIVEAAGFLRGDDLFGVHLL
jgi:hypothetical protein